MKNSIRQPKSLLIHWKKLKPKQKRVFSALMSSLTIWLLVEKDKSAIGQYLK
jgi:hypothetical protein